VTQDIIGTAGCHDAFENSSHADWIVIVNILGTDSRSRESK
jgi:hypothetical protein